MRRGVFDNQCQFCLIWASLFPAFLTSFLQKERRKSTINNKFNNLLILKICQIVNLPLASSFSCKAALISMMPVFLMNSGRSNGGFSIPRLPCK